MTDEDLLSAMIKGIWVEHEFEPEYQSDNNVKTVNLLLGLPMAVTEFKAKFRKVRELAVGQAPKDGAKAGEKDGEGKKAEGKKVAAAEKKVKNMPDFEAVNKVKIALFSTPDRVYVVALAGPEGPFSKVVPKFDDVLKSVKLNLDIQKK
jgi:hypothetical protein